LGAQYLREAARHGGGIGSPGTLVMSIHPTIQKLLLDPGLSRKPGIAVAVPEGAVNRLQTLPEFRKAFEVDGLQEREFITFGLTQKTLSQFSTGGWSLLEAFK
jgi:hypothetical protein